MYRSWSGIFPGLNLLTNVATTGYSFVDLGAHKADHQERIKVLGCFLNIFFQQNFYSKLNETWYCGKFEMHKIVALVFWLSVSINSAQNTAQRDMISLITKLAFPELIVSTAGPRLVTIVISPSCLLEINEEPAWEEPFV